MHDSISSAPLESARKAPASAPIPMERVLSRYGQFASSMEKQFHDLKKDRDETTGFFNVLADDIVGMAGGETWREIYKRSWENIAATCKWLLARMESDIAGRNLTDTERSQVDALRKQLTSLIHKPWEEASVAKSIVATAKALPETAVDNTKHAAYGAYGIGKGILHGAVDIFDMTKLLVGVAVDAKQRAEVSRQCRLIGECLQQEGFASIAWEQAKELVAKEWERIQKLPSEQQSEAIGKMAGTVIFSLAAIKWGMALGKHAVNLSEKTARATTLLGKAAEGSLRAEKLAAIAQTTKRLSIGGSILAGVIGGPAESLIGMWLAKTLAPAFEIIHSATAPAIQKLRAIKSGLAMVKEAEKTATPEVRNQLTKVEHALNAEEAKLKVSHIQPETPSLKYRIEAIGAKKALRLETVASTEKLQEEVLKLLRKHPEVSEIHLGPEFPSSAKRALMDIMSENRPLLGVMRIIPEGRVGTFIIRGVKPINDTLSQQTADKILAGIREHITKTLDERYGLGKAARITTSHNKITVALPKEIRTALPSQREIDLVVQKAIAEQREVIEASAARLGKTPEEIKKALADLRVNAGESRVPASADDFAKLEAVAESEIQARGGASGAERVARMKEIQKLKSDIIQEFQGAKFIHGKYKYPVVTLDTAGKPRLHPLIADTVRKPGGVESLRPAELGKRVESYLNALNRELDYVAPALNFEQGFQSAREIDHAFREGRIPRQALETTYKGSLSKEAFHEATRGKTGVCVMIDVKGMFGKNSAALERVSQNIAEAGADVSAIERLDAVGSITRAFMRGTGRIDHAHPNILSTHGGDEYMYFIEGAKESDIPNILQRARTSLGNQGFDIRASAREATASREVFDALDGETKIAKAIESLGRTRTGESPAFLRHVEVSAESFSPDHIVRELHRQRTAVERAIRNVGVRETGNNTLELQWLRLRIERTWHDSVRITALHALQHAA